MRVVTRCFPLLVSLTLGCFVFACGKSPGPTLAGFAGTTEAGRDSGRSGDGAAGTEAAGGGAGAKAASNRRRTGGMAGNAEGGAAGSGDVESRAGNGPAHAGGARSQDGHGDLGGDGAVAGAGPQGREGGQAGAGGDPAAVAGTGPDDTGGRVGTGGMAAGGAATGGTATGGDATGGTGGNDPDCLPGEVRAAEGACILRGLVDDFGSCDSEIYEAEGRNGGWYTYHGIDVDCEESSCHGIGVPPWASDCGAWITGGYDPYYLPAYPDLYAGVGVTLNDVSMFYDVCDYADVEVRYASDQAVRFYAKWDDIGEYGDRYYVSLPATSGIVTTSVPLSRFSGLDCSRTTELQFEPTDLTGFGIAVYSVRFTGLSSADCAEGDSRCTGGGALEVCTGGEWVASSCDAGQVCSGNRCVAEDATPVEIHGHLSVSGTALVDESGAPVQLKGISSMWLNYETDGYATNAEAMVWMRDHWGITVFRAAMGADEDHPGSYVIDAASRADMTTQVDTIIENAIDAGLYVIVDWHSHHTYTEEASEFFAYIGENYGSYPNVLIETYNEPLNVSWTSALKPYHEAVVAAFRAADPNNATHPNVAILGTPNWDLDVDVAATRPVAGVNLMYTAHFYACSHGSTYLNKARAALNAGLPIFVTEWGATDANGGEYPDDDVCTAEANLWHDWMDANGVGWAAWKLDDCDGQTHPDASCLLTLNAPVTGGWTSEYLNGHASYVVSKL
jgi:aryl-phospho-beta-D-glucosidase BglC (GH1 family)